MRRKEKPRLPRARLQINPTTRVHGGRRKPEPALAPAVDDDAGPGDARYCSRCGAEMTGAVLDGVRRMRCPVCGHVAYRNPIPAAGVIVERDGGVVIVKRKFEPKAGLWSLPAGFMEYSESPEQCAVREAREETGLLVTLGDLVGVYAGDDDPRTRAVLIVYRASAAGGELSAGDDASEIAIVPWGQLDRYQFAFAAHVRALRDARGSSA